MIITIWSNTWIEKNFIKAFCFVSILLYGWEIMNYSKKGKKRVFLAYFAYKLNKIFVFYLHYLFKGSGVWEEFCTFFPATNISQCVKSTLNKTESTLNNTFTGLRSMLQGFQIYFTWNPSWKGFAGKHSQFSQNRFEWGQISCATQPALPCPYS